MPRPKSDRSRVPINMLAVNKKKLKRIAEARGGIAMSTAVEQLIAEEFAKRFSSIAESDKRDGEAQGRAVVNQ